MFPIPEKGPAQPKVERRLHPRDRVLVPSRAYLGPFGEQASCIIRDWSAQGARIKLVDSHPPDALSIDIDILGERRTGRVVWRRGQEMGLSFAQMADPVDAQISALRETLRQIRGW